MPIQTSKSRYGALAQAFHWIIAALIVAQFVLGRTAVGLPSGAEKLKLLARHKSIGMTVLMLAILRLLWRLANPPPPLPLGMTSGERNLARLGEVNGKLAGTLHEARRGQAGDFGGE